jgi:hypothetical protein
MIKEHDCVDLTTNVPDEGLDAGTSARSCTSTSFPRTARTCTLLPLSTVAEIKAAIARLTLEERAEVARCLHQWEDDAWDKQMQQDLAAGKFDRLLAKVDTEIDQGKLREMP